MTLRLLPLLGVALAACAGHKAASKECAPVPVSFMTAGPVYAECAVDQKAAEPRISPRLQYTRPTGVRSGCLKTVVDVVVDSSGNTVMSTAKVVSSTDQGFTDAVMSGLAQTRYTPAEKDGHRVSQLVRHERRMAFATVSVPAGSGPPSGPPPGAAPRC